MIYNPQNITLETAKGLPCALVLNGQRENLSLLPKDQTLDGYSTRDIYISSGFVVKIDNPLAPLYIRRQGLGELRFWQGIIGSEYSKHFAELVAYIELGKLKASIQRRYNFVSRDFTSEHELVFRHLEQIFCDELLDVSLDNDDSNQPLNCAVTDSGEFVIYDYAILG